MSGRTALCAERLFDGTRFHSGRALLVGDDLVERLCAADEIPADARRVDLGATLLCPGFVDWQVNGGGGRLLNAHRDRASVETIARAHARFGTTALLPTVITDTDAVLDEAADAVAEAIAAGVPGVVGLHVEGPGLSPARPGVHDPSLIRALGERDLARLCRDDLGVVVTTLACERTPAALIGELARAGVVVSVGHSDASYEEAHAGFDAGARAVTHLFNAMRPLHHREPGLVGAACERDEVTVGLIADGHHVHPSVLGMALSLLAPDRLSLVTDAMSTVGTELERFELGGRTVHRRGGRLATEDGTLAGSDLDMASAVRLLVERCGHGLAGTLRAASTNPARLLGLRDRGHLGPGARADLVALDASLRVRAVMIGGREAFRAA